MNGVIERRWLDPELLLKALPSVVLQTSCFLAPLLMTFVLTFQRTRNFQLNWTWSLDTWIDIFTKPHYWTILGHTLAMATICVGLCALISFPIAYALATRLRAWRNHVKVLITFAFLTDSTLKIFGWVLFLDQRGAANYVLQQIGIEAHVDAILFTDWATMLGMVYSLLAFAIFTAYLSIDAIDRSLILAAYDAGASKLRAFWEVTLPLCRPGIWAGAVLTFLLSSGVSWNPRCWPAANRPCRPTSSARRSKPG